MYPVNNRINLAPLELCVDAVREEGVAGFVLEVHDALIGVTGDLYTLDVLCVQDLLNERTVIRREVFEAGDVDFVDYEESGFAAKERLDGVEEFALRFA